MLGRTLGAMLLMAAGAASAQDKDTIQALSDQLAEALRAGDAGAAAALYTEDATLLPPGAPMVRGRDGIEAFWGQAIAGVDDIALTTERVTPLGDGIAEEIGSVVITTTGDQPQEITGKYVVIWEETEEGWKLATDIWNLDQ